MSFWVIFCPFFLPAFARDRFHSAVECGGNGVPEVEERVLLEADVHEHRLDALLDVPHLPLVDRSDDVAVGLAFGGVFLEAIVLQQRDALFKPLATDNKFDPGVLLSEA